MVVCLIWGMNAWAQKNAIVYGVIRDSIGRAIADVNITAIGTGQLTISNENGYFQLSVPSNIPFEVGISYTGRPSKKVAVKALLPGERYELNVRMDYGVGLNEVVIIEERDRDKVSMQTIDPKTVSTLPNASGSFESILKTLPGVVSNNEMSSQYNVRGGNYDENLIYVNDIEIYRPFLPRSGQQEGLSFIHTDLVENVKFSAGGFEARYGDKLSSVLDIQYKKPKKVKSSVNASLMGVIAHLEGASKNKRFTYLLGARYWTNQYLVGTLDTKGNYQPSYTDIQTLLTYHLKDNLSISFLGSYAQNRYLVVPESRETVFGTVKQALALRIFFNGSDLMEYKTGIGAVSLNYQPTQQTQLKLYTSVFASTEREFFTLEGAYRLEEVETDFGSDNFGKSKASKGVGYFLNNARNELNAVVANFGHRGTHHYGNNTLQWGAQVQVESIKDDLNEWQYLDSLGFSKPTLVNGEIVLIDYQNAQNTLQSYRLNGYVQHSQMLYKPSNMRLTYGVRSNWWSYNQENVISPRVQFSFEPNRQHNKAAFGDKTAKVKKDIILKAAIGVYYQPPFYREMRYFGGSLNPDIKAQRSIHYIVGGDMNFKAWGRPFKFFAESYYKQMDNLIPYEIDNVRIRYYATNSSSGYATGLDMRVNGEFVKGTESWLSVSLLDTKEKINGQTDKDGNAIEPHYVRRPTDQRVTVSMMFQDYLPKFPSYRMQLSLVYGSGLPFGPPDRNRYGDTLTMPAYRRVDIGFLKILVDENDTKEKKGWKKHFRAAQIGVEVFNLLDVQNTISYLWIQDVEARTWAVPNYLTARRINVRLIAKF